MNTFKDLYDFLRRYDGDIISWLEEAWDGKDKQESLLRLFAGLDLIGKLRDYVVCTGNFNKKNIKKQKSYKDVFYNDGELINLKDKGDKSDLTLVHRENDKVIVVTSSKNREKEKSDNIGNYDIRDIHSIYEAKYKNYDALVYCICTRDSERFRKKVDNCEECNNDIRDKLDQSTTIIIDWEDLREAYNKFKISFGRRTVKSIVKVNKRPLYLKMHQRMSVMKTIKMRDEGKKKILWGHIQRSGKSYIIGGCIVGDSVDKGACNYLVITTAPNETIKQYVKVFESMEFDKFKVIVLNGKTRKPVLRKRNIIICSKQFLQTKIDSVEKTRSITWLKNMNFDMRFIDESHNGGTTELAQKTLEYYGNNSLTVQITATYSKPINDYNIPRDSWILWDLEDIKFGKEGNIDKLIEKHGEDIREIVEEYSIDNIVKEYSEYPELYILTNEIKEDVVSEIVEETKDNNYGYSTEGCFLLLQSMKDDKLHTKSRFQNEKKHLDMWYRIFGKTGKYGSPDKQYPDDIVFMKRIEKICKDSTIDSRFIGEGDFDNEPMIIMAFLPVFTDRGEGYLSKMSKS